MRPGPDPIPATPPTPSPYTTSGNKSFDANVVMVLSVLLCALVCSLGLNSIIRCVLKCSNFVHSGSMIGPEIPVSTRLANTGIKKKALRTFPTVSYWEGLKLPGLNKECVICLNEFVSEEHVKILPKCNHGFHVRCIDKWLGSHSSCPTCRHSVVESSQKMVSGRACGGATPPQIQGEIPSAISIVPLQPERFVQNYGV